MIRETGRSQRTWRCDCGCRSYVSVMWTVFHDGDVSAFVEVVGPANASPRERLRQAWSALRGCRYHSGPEVMLTAPTAREMRDALARATELLEGGADA